MQIGRYEPDTARWVVDRLKWLLSQQTFSPNELLAALGGVANQRVVHVRNTDAADADPYACMQVVGIENPASGSVDRTYLQVQKPTDQYGRDGWYLFNGPEEIPADGYGVAYEGPHARVYGISASVGDRCLPQVNDWQVTKDPTGWMHYCGADDVADDVSRVLCNPIMSIVAFFETPVGGIDAASTSYGKATCDLKKPSLDGSNDLTLAAALDETSTQITHTVYNQSSDAVGASQIIQAVLIDGLWIANYEDCAPGA